MLSNAILKLKKQLKFFSYYNTSFGLFLFPSDDVIGNIYTKKLKITSNEKALHASCVITKRNSKKLALIVMHHRKNLRFAVHCA